MHRQNKKNDFKIKFLDNIKSSLALHPSLTRIEVDISWVGTAEVVGPSDVLLFLLMRGGYTT